MPGDIRQERHLHRIPVKLVVRVGLVVPLELARIRVQSDDGARVEIVAGTHITVVIRTGISYAPVGQIGFRIVGAGGPYGAAPVFPRIIPPAGFSRVTRSSGGIEPPLFLTCVRIVGCNEAADPIFPSGNADDDFVLDDQRRNRHRVAGRCAGDGRVP